jgi:hypothetical protein
MTFNNLEKARIYFVYLYCNRNYYIFDKIIFGYSCIKVIFITKLLPPLNTHFLSLLKKLFFEKLFLINSYIKLFLKLFLGFDFIKNVSQTAVILSYKLIFPLKKGCNKQPQNLF